MVGLVAEARIAGRFGYPVEAGGGTPEGAARAATRLVEQGVTALVSFGLAGGLDPDLRPGAVIVPSVLMPIQTAGPGHPNTDGSCADCQLFYPDKGLAALFGGPTPHTLLAGSQIVADATSKRRLYVETNAHAIDLESGAVAKVASANGLPFLVVRAICDSAERDLPPAASVALDSKGNIGLVGVLLSVLRHPGQIPGLLALARDAARARRALIQLVERFHAEVRRSNR